MDFAGNLVSKGKMILSDEEFDGERYDFLRDSIQRKFVLKYKREECYNGYNLFATYRSTTFYLMDMEGKMVHTWTIGSWLDRGAKFAKIGELMPNGNLVFGHMWYGMSEVNWRSRELWYYACTQHHDFHVMPNGHIIILCGGMGNPERRCNPKIYEGGEYIASYFIEVDPKTGDVFWRWESDEHIGKLRELGVEFPRPIRGGRLVDVFHSNTCEVLPDTRLGRKDSRFKAGNVVFSHRNLDVVGVIDKDTGEIVWAYGPGILDMQHMPTLIPDTHPITKENMPGAGHFLIYDNGELRRWTRVIELDPETEEVVWSYSQKGWWCGYGLGGAERMPNGNTVICEGGTRGRLFEVTPRGEIVWEYITPYYDGWNTVGGMTSKHSIYRVIRYPPEYVENILSMQR